MHGGANPLSRNGPISPGIEVKSNTLVLQKGITPTVRPPPLVLVPAAVGLVEIGSLPTCTVGQNAEGASVRDVGVSARVVPYIYLLGAASAVFAGEGTNLEGIGACAEAS